MCVELRLDDCADTLEGVRALSYLFASMSVFSRIYLIHKFLVHVSRNANVQHGTTLIQGTLASDPMVIS